MKEISLTQGYVAIVDDEDYEELMRHRWHADEMRPGAHAVRSLWDSKNRKSIGITMARQIMKAPPHMQVDHRNHDRLDNRRANLRICTASQNQANRRKWGKSSRWKGVYKAPAPGKWRTQLRAYGKKYDLGTFTDEDVAARAYNVAALEHFGEFALLNELD